MRLDLDVARARLSEVDEQWMLKASDNCRVAALRGRRDAPAPVSDSRDDMPSLKAQFKKASSLVERAPPLGRVLWMGLSALWMLFGGRVVDVVCGGRWW